MKCRLVIQLVLAALTLCGCNLQRHMLYYPSTNPPSQEVLAARNLQFWPVGPREHRGLVGRRPEAGGKGTVVVFHGNAGAAADRAFYVDALAPLGYRVILAEYPGYGGRTGNPGEEAFVGDARETLRLAFEQFGGPLFLLGESLGCGVVAAAARTAPVKTDGLILITPWDTLTSVAKAHFPWLPVSLFLRDKYDTVRNLKAYQGKIAVIGAERDDVIPMEHALKLFASLPGHKKMWTIREAGHNDWPGIVGPAWWRELAAFMEEK